MGVFCGVVGVAPAVMQAPSPADSRQARRQARASHPPGSLPAPAARGRQAPSSRSSWGSGRRRRRHATKAARPTRLPPNDPAHRPDRPIRAFRRCDVRQISHRPMIPPNAPANKPRKRIISASSPSISAVERRAPSVRARSRRVRTTRRARSRRRARPRRSSLSRSSTAAPRAAQMLGADELLGLAFAANATDTALAFAARMSSTVL